MIEVSGSLAAPPVALAKPRALLVPVGILSFVMIALFGILQFHDVQAGKEAVRAIEESNLRQRTISDYLRVLQDIETGQRGYVVTGNRDFLEPQMRAQRIASAIER